MGQTLVSGRIEGKTAHLSLAPEAFGKKDRGPHALVCRKPRRPPFRRDLDGLSPDYPHTRDSLGLGSFFRTRRTGQLAAQPIREYVTG